MSLSPRFLILPFIFINFFSETYSQNSWRILPRPTSQNLSSLSFVDSLTGWAVGDSGTILKTTNGGEGWIVQNSNVVYPILHVFTVNENYGWALAHNYEFDSTMTFGTTMLRTVDGGSQWSSQLYQNEFFTSVFFFDSLVGIMGGVFGSIVWTTDGGESWTPAEVDTSWFSRYPILGIRFYSRLYGYAVGGAMDIVGVIWKTTDGGLHWESMAVGPEPVHDVHFVDSLNIICVSGDLDFGSGLITSTNAGQAWEYTYLGIWGEARALAFRTPAEAWSPLGFPGTYMYTLNSGETWCDTYAPDSSAVFDAVFTDSLTGYMVGEGGTILKYSGQPAPDIRIGNDTLTLTAVNSWSDSFYVRNCGTTLIVDSIVLFSSEPTSYSISIEPPFFQVPFGDTQLVRVQMATTNVSTVFDFQDSLFIYSNDPLIPMKIVVLRGDILTSSADGYIPTKTVLFQNFPNPFNPMTEIRYRITGAKWVRLRVFDLLGREVRALVDGLQFPGEYTVTWDARGVASGLYFYQLITGDYIQMRKMFLIK